MRQVRISAESIDYYDGNVISVRDYEGSVRSRRLIFTLEESESDEDYIGSIQPVWSSECAVHVLCHNISGIYRDGEIDINKNITLFADGEICND